jgi:prepilin-type N-terminal cleavage/methylation domain-containing protein
MQSAFDSKKGFTIVELLIVIVVIAILATISIVAYSGMQQRARDSERSAELVNLQKAIELYRVDFGGYPKCGAMGPNIPAAFSSGLVQSCLADELVPTYITTLPVDPTNDGAQYAYRYAAGYSKTGASTYNSATPADNYILGVRQETVSAPTFSGWGQSGLTLLLGSNN